MTRLKVDINHNYNKTDSLENLTNKHRNKTVKVTELIEIFETLGYETVVKKNKPIDIYLNKIGTCFRVV